MLHRYVSYGAHLGGHYFSYLDNRKMITAVMIDSREPSWVKELRFEGVPVSVATLDAGDLMMATEDGCIVIVERKTPDDFLNTLKADRLFPQAAKLAGMRNATCWPYLVITGPFWPGSGGKVVTQHRQTGWNWGSVWGAITSIQEMGVPVVFAASDVDYEAFVLRLAKRSRDVGMRVLPPRPPQVLGTQGAILASLPGIGIEKVLPILEECGGMLAYALEGITGDHKIAGIGPVTRQKIRDVLGLTDDVYLSVEKLPEQKE